jgi:mRNA interferase MazF
MTTVAPWQVWWTEFDPQVGREQAGRRPAIVVGTAFACSLPNDLVLLVPITTRDRGLPFHPPLALGFASFAMCDQIKSASRQRLQALHQQRLSDEEITTIRFALRKLIDVQ